jgi:hypothetical protein
MKLTSLLTSATPISLTPPITTLSTATLSTATPISLTPPFTTLTTTPPTIIDYIGMDRMDEGKLFLGCLTESYDLYFKHGARSNKKVDYFHNYIKKQLETMFVSTNGYTTKLEQNVKSSNSNGRKKCDIVVFKHDVPYIVFPVKLVMTNYKQNKNNGWEALTGEVVHLKWENPYLNIIPINIYMNSTPYLTSDKKIKNFENITYKDIAQYEILKEKGLTFDMINYIIDVNQNCEIGAEFCTLPTLLGFDTATHYKKLDSILSSLM